MAARMDVPVNIVVCVERISSVDIDGEVLGEAVWSVVAVAVALSLTVT